MFKTTVSAIAIAAIVFSAGGAFALGDTSASASASAAATGNGGAGGAGGQGGRGGSARQGQAQGQVQGQSQSSRQTTKQLNEQSQRNNQRSSSESNSGGNSQSVDGDSVEGSFAFGYAAPSVAVTSNNVIGTQELVKTYGMQFPVVGGAYWDSQVVTTIGGVPAVVEALKIAGDPEYAASATKTTALGPDEATSRAYAAVMCVNFEDAAKAYGLACE